MQMSATCCTSQPTSRSGPTAERGKPWSSSSRVKPARWVSPGHRVQRSELERLADVLRFEVGILGKQLVTVRAGLVGVGRPIFTPYLEVPRLPEYGFEVVEVAQDEAAGWRYPVAQIDKLRDPRVKVFLAVNPSNPTAVAMDAATVERYCGALRGAQG